jgi:uncharacterized protein (TIGR00645 family)
MPQRFNTFVRALLLGTRWAMAPLCLGLGAALLIVMVQFVRELVHVVVGFDGLRGAEVILEVLKLVDLVLVANLLLMIISAGIEIFLPSADVNGDRSPHFGIAEFAALKPKLFASISAIAAIDLLESFVNIESVDKAAVLWEILILLAFVISGVLLAGMDRLEGHE